MSTDRHYLDKSDGQALRRILLASLVPADATLLSNNHIGWRRFLCVSKHYDLAKLSKLRTDVLDGVRTNATARHGRSEWLADTTHAEWKREMIVWLEAEGPTKVAPGKRGYVTQHYREDGKREVPSLHRLLSGNHSYMISAGTGPIAFHGRGKTDPSRHTSCNQYCRHHALHYKTDTDEVLYKQFLVAHPHIIPSQFTRQRYSQLKPFWVRAKPREVCACPYHAQAHALLEGVRRAVTRVHGGDGPCTCACDLCRDGACKTYLNDTDSLVRHWLCGTVDFKNIYSFEADADEILRHTKCVIGECETCGRRDPFVGCPAETSIHDSIVSWYENVRNSKNS